MSKIIYSVIDFYDKPANGDIIDEYDSLKKAKKAAHDYFYNDCDGEAYVEIWGRCDDIRWRIDC